MMVNRSSEAGNTVFAKMLKTRMYFPNNNLNTLNNGHIITMPHNWFEFCTFVLRQAETYLP
jgi:hypothetical protein